MQEALQHVFGDDFFTIMIRVLIALLLSGIIGFERGLNNHSAGFRTHILVGVGACLMMLFSFYGFEEFIEEYNNIRFDPARIPSYVISGIGFLGAGTIIVYGGTIRGLTTAASIWTVAGIGLVVGAGMYGAAIFTTFIILLSLVFLNNFEKLFTKGNSSNLIEIIALPDLQINEVISAFEKFDSVIKKVEITKSENNIRNIFVKIERKSNLDRVALVEEISKIEHVKNISEIK
ncbi:putative Mg2+ transporter-C (MgtC) family protein [Virgibacillus natechei]|uniref:Mg2+ transporter-C (MgtC) family protein n=1 Tax=Virgibacillus natechei TaxID=1216297 RepID=A0ABS4IIP8_9BACI|nr:MgtC/SapB family protein [Virgibacillus natechei]MBP1970833.1 putative Mg2+ transporter-C (MgtC) family protein [Virgibacillus natechei]UZD13219.1 MgtC/SapB family protein [Virgibacillus natechei]